MSPSSSRHCFVPAVFCPAASFPEYVLKPQAVAVAYVEFRVAESGACRKVEFIRGIFEKRREYEYVVHGFSRSYRAFRYVYHRGVRAAHVLTVLF